MELTLRDPIGLKDPQALLEPVNATGDATEEAIRQKTAASAIRAIAELTAGTDLETITLNPKLAIVLQNVAFIALNATTGRIRCMPAKNTFASNHRFCSGCILNVTLLCAP